VLGLFPYLAAFLFELAKPPGDCRRRDRGFAVGGLFLHHDVSRFCRGSVVNA